MSARRYTDFAIYKRLLREARPYWLHLASILLLYLLSTPLALLTPLPMKIVVDSVIGSHPIPELLHRLIPVVHTGGSVAILLLAVALALAIALAHQLQSLGNSLLSTYTGEKMALDFQTKLFRHAQRLSLSYHDSIGTSDSTYRIRYDAPAIQWILVNSIIPVTASLAKLVGMIYVTTRINTELAVVALAISPILFAISRAYRPSLRTQWHDVYKLQSSAMSVVQETLSAIRVVKAFGQEAREQDRFARHSLKGFWAHIRVTLVQGSYGLLVGLTTAAGMTAILFIGAQRVQSGALTIGDLLIVMAYVGELYGPLEKLGWTSVSLQSSMAGAERAISLLDEPPDPIERKNARRISRARGVVAFQDVSFAYSKDQPVLQSISFEVPPGIHVGISGATGAGKTTLISLLTRFYDPTEGRILLDGIDLRDFRLADLRNQFAIVLQEPVLFSTTIAENIAYGRPGCELSEIVKGAKAANAHDFISRLPEGYETRVGERGMTLSGGERQRISLARAFLKDAPILIMDEPTSSVDLQTEAAIMDAMTLLSEGRTTFIIAHRLSTLEKCDMYVAIENGYLQVLAPTSPIPQDTESFRSQGKRPLRRPLAWISRWQEGKSR
ncbi:MAG: ABC transporter ATP-binding protein [Chloroflexi bacterium]|nr:ABC transporter ATP-binding protein [Chloroflexota bacterium]